MKREAGNSQETGSRTDSPSKFDPASWLDWAERCGYRIYLFGAAKKRPFRIMTEPPKGRRSLEDVALWHAFQGSPKQSKVNRAILIAYLVKAGRFGSTGSDTRPAPRANTKGINLAVRAICVSFDKADGAKGLVAVGTQSLGDRCRLELERPNGPR